MEGGVSLGLWSLFAVLTLAGLAYLGVTMAYGGPRHLLLIGQTTSGHHQIELSCDSCHTDWFGGRAAIEQGCRNCHAADLEAANDNHRAAKFRDPRNAQRLERINVTQCLTCHVEHNADATRVMGVTLPMDYCVACHADIGEERETHKGLAFTTCADAGCHNYHDNRTLYEDFLVQHLDEPEVLDNPVIALASWDASAYAATATAATAPDAPHSIAFDTQIAQDWLSTAHAAAGVNCTGCHQPRGATAWIDAPGMNECATCHADQAAGFVRGRHGMRLAENMLISRAGPLTREERLSPMRPELARLPMHAEAAHRDLTCNTCHGAHGFDTNRAQVEACASCHADEHSAAYFSSPHYSLWRAELTGAAPIGSGVSCATCHMPRELHKGADGVERMVVQHNQNDNLRPNEKMARNVCMNCHGLSYTLDALADRNLVDRNFTGRSSTHIEGIDWAGQRLRAREAGR